MQRSVSPILKLVPGGTLACAMVLAGFLLAVSGCNIIGPAVVLIHGPDKTDALTKLDSARNHVIFLDDRENRLTRRVLRQEILDSAQARLIEKGILSKEKLIDGRGAIMAAASETDGSPLSITAIGRSVEADVVIYVTIDAFGLSPDGSVYQPFAHARIKIIDAVNDVKLWPETSKFPGGYEVNLTMRPQARDLPRTNAEIAKAQSEVAREFGEAIAEVFFEHETRDPDRGAPAP